jgi:hypothetical protein
VGGGAICAGIPFETPVFPAPPAGGIQSFDRAFPKACPVDSSSGKRVRLLLVNVIVTGLLVALRG